MKYRPLYALPNILDEKIAVSQQTWKKLVKKAIKDKSEVAIKFKSYSKLRDKNYKAENLHFKPYIS